PGAVPSASSSRPDSSSTQRVTRLPVWVRNTAIASHISPIGTSALNSAMSNQVKPASSTTSPTADHGYRAAMNPLCGGCSSYEVQRSAMKYHAAATSAATAPAQPSGRTQSATATVMISHHASWI